MPCRTCSFFDGRGFEQRHVAANSLGLSIMRERAVKIGATLENDSAVGQGTTVRCQWPVPQAHR